MAPDPHFKADSPIKNIEENKFKIYPRALNITWGKDKRFWNLPHRDTRNEDSFAELKQVCWLEVTGSTEKDVLVEEKYKVGFVISLRPDAFGWDDCSVYIMAKIGRRGNYSFKKMSLAALPTGKRITIPDDDQLIIQVPAFKPDNDDLKLYFGLYEVWTNRWKGGLRIHHAFVEIVE
ncbi:protein PHLOEM PROTEIN 2-LIKE A9-like [Benincasa hispida]|uniref:protein PHLOEM PROTEIN 2-LIKE A9-like n=1 Tax=Benincasa hispida TaxID=102211 RepID=UPI001902230A|nr:protein PHLOEM PROTEIN 2-LIKE A9-like [Benincasa hispida]